MRNDKVMGINWRRNLLQKKNRARTEMGCACHEVLLTVSMPIALIWSALFSVIDKNFFGSDKASTISARKKETPTFNDLQRHLEINLLQELYSTPAVMSHSLQ